MNHRHRGFFLYVLLAISGGLLAAGPVGAQGAGIKNPTEIWSAWGGDFRFMTFQGVLDDAELAFDTTGEEVTRSDFALSVQNLGSLEFHAPEGAFAGFVGGRLSIEAGLSVRTSARSLSFDHLHVFGAQSGRLPSLIIRDTAGREIFTADYIQMHVNAADQSLRLSNMDFRIGRDLADMLGKPYLNGQVFGLLNMELNLNIPAGAVTHSRGDVCADRPQWPTEGFIADVGLIAMSSVGDFDTFSDGANTFDVIAPAAHLKSLVGVDGADVPWFAKFSGVFPPYNNDQHPYLVWTMYRVDNAGVIEQIGHSAAKHAFSTLNFNCTISCGDGGIPGAGGSILWPGCEDVYGSGTNNLDSVLGPRDEINPRTGVFVSTGSFFDPGGTGMQTNNSDGVGENRMNVLRTDLQTAGAEYFIEAWYVIRQDSNIFNTMGSRSLTGTLNGDNWSFALGDFIQGPVIDRWVAPATDPNTGSQNVTYAEPDTNGHFKLAVRTVDLGAGQFRYTYLLNNFDVDNGLSELDLNVSAGNVSGIGFSDDDLDAGNDWTLAPGGDLSFRAVGGNVMPWGNAYTFTFTAGPPHPGQAMVRIGDMASQTTANVNILVPDLSEEFLIDGFEDL